MSLSRLCGHANDGVMNKRQFLRLGLQIGVAALGGAGAMFGLKHLRRQKAATKGSPMKFKYDKRLERLLAEIERTLVAETPRAVAALKIREPAYAVFLWYDDSTVEDWALDFGIGLEAFRSTWAKRRAEASTVTEDLWEYLWRPQQVMEQLPPHGQFQDAAFTAKCAEAYELTFAANETEFPLEDERELMLPFRAMMCRAASRLNQHAWNTILNTTEQFVVLASDRLGHWVDEDLKQSIPPAKFELLRRRGELPPERYAKPQ